jgi:hypothetical protein
MMHRKIGESVKQGREVLNRNVDPYRWVHIGIWLGAAPILIWRFAARGVWPDFSLAAYLLTAYTVAAFIVMYPGPGTSWFWKLVLAASIVHGVLLGALGIGATVLIKAKTKMPTMYFLHKFTQDASSPH